MDSTLSKQNHISSRDDEKYSKFLKKKIWEPIVRTILWNLKQLARSWIGFMGDPLRAVPKHIELQSELYDFWKKEFRPYWVILGLREIGGQKQRSGIAICEMWKIFRQMARHFVNVASIHHLTGRSFFFGAEVIFYFACAKTNVECISSAYKSVVWWWSICSGYGWSKTDDTIRDSR